MFVLSIRSRKTLFVSGLVGIVVLGVAVLVLHGPIVNFIVGGHTSAEGISTVTKRLYLWQSALKMIQDHPWSGVGMENWLCYYSPNSVCFNPTLVNHYYWILHDPVTGAVTGLSEEPTLSHPHNIFLQVCAALIQGQVDSSFLEQDLSFCFWMLITALLLLRVLTGTPWRGRLRPEHGF